ncbi:hypothetical protein ABIB95_002114 [Bradyrhizobium sp. LA2.1]
MSFLTMEAALRKLVAIQFVHVATRANLVEQNERIALMVGKARRKLSTMDIVGLREYSLHGLSMDTNPEVMCLDGPAP